MQSALYVTFCSVFAFPVRCPATAQASRGAKIRRKSPHFCVFREDSVQRVPLFWPDCSSSWPAAIVVAGLLTRATRLARHVAVVAAYPTEPYAHDRKVSHLAPPVPKIMRSAVETNAGAGDPRATGASSCDCSRTLFRGSRHMECAYYFASLNVSINSLLHRRERR